MEVAKYVKILLTHLKLLVHVKVLAILLQNAEISKFHCDSVFHMIMCMSCVWLLIIIHIFIYVTHQKLFYSCRFINYFRSVNYTN